MSPTQRSLAMLRAEGYTVAVVERWNPYAMIRQDLFGFADLVAVHPKRRGTLYVQTTTGSNMVARQHKLTACAAVAVCLSAGNRVVLHGWRKVATGRKKDGGRSKAKRWECRVVELK